MRQRHFADAQRKLQLRRTGPLIGRLLFSSIGRVDATAPSTLGTTASPTYHLPAGRNPQGS